MAQSRLGSQNRFVSSGPDTIKIWNWDPIISQANGKRNGTYPKCCFEDTLSKNAGKAGILPFTWTVIFSGFAYVGYFIEIAQISNASAQYSKVQSFQVQNLCLRKFTDVFLGINISNK